MDRPPIDPSKILAQRHNLANLRIQLRLAESLVTELDEFERGWDKFVEAMRQIIKACEERGLSLWDPGSDEMVRKAEAIRHDLASRQQIVLPEFRDPLAKFLRTSVRTHSDALWSLIGVTRTMDGRMMVPLGVDGEPMYQVSLKTFEINADEARSEIARRRRILNEDVSKLKIMLEESQRAQDEAQRLESERIQAAKRTRLAWASLKDSRIGKIVWWLVEEPLRRWLLAVLVAAAAIPPIRQGIAALVRWIVSRF